MPDKNRPINIVIFGWFEILIGFLGSIFFLMSLEFLLRSLHYLQTHIINVYTIGVDVEMFDLGILYCMMTSPYPIILILGLSMLQLNSLARKINILLAPFVLMLGGSFIYLSSSVSYREMKWSSFLILFIPLIIVSIIAVFFLTRRRVKQAFSERNP